MAPCVQRCKVWLTPTTRVPCSNAGKMRNPLKFAGVPQSGKPMSAAIGLTYWCLTSFFPIVDTCLSCEDIARQSATVPRWRFLRPVFFSEPRAAGFRPASEIHTKATPCVEVWQTSNLRRLRLGEEKERKKEVTTRQKYNGLPYSIGRP